MSDLIRLTPFGLEGPDKNFYIDAWGRAPINLVTHGHADHARPGSIEYWCTNPTVEILKTRLGGGTNVRGFEYGEKVKIGRSWISFHPAGHILGSAQVRVECDSQVWVFTGDYKRDADESCEKFEAVACDTLITEATFGLPIYSWREPLEVAGQIYSWWQLCKEEKVTALLFCYSLGKAQRILNELTKFTEDSIVIHGAVNTLTQIYRSHGIKMLPTVLLSEFTGELEGQLVLAPPSAHRSPWMKRFKSVSTAFASGWMAVRGIRRRHGYDRGFVLSDHSDWKGLIRTVKESRASRVLVTHGNSESFARYLSEEEKIPSQALRTEFGDDEGEREMSA